MVIYLRAMRNNLLILLTILTMQLLAQDHSTCDGEKYRTIVFSEVEVQADIKFSEGKTIGGNDKELFLDIYSPKNDATANRPVIVLGFGGSFISGKRTDIAWLCEDYAKRGFVAIAIDYRLYDLPLIPFPAASDMQVVVIKSVVDMTAALQYMINDAEGANNYRIDTNAMFVGGISSGSIMACHTAMLDTSDNLPSYIVTKLRNEGLLDAGKNMIGSKNIKGVINFSGALHIGSWYESSDPPLFSCHDDADGTVPYKSGYGQVFGQNIVELEGSFMLDSFAKIRGMNSEMVTIPNSAGHVSYFAEEVQRNDVVNKSAVFLYKLLCSDRVDVPSLKEEVFYTISPNPFMDDITVQLAVASSSKICILDLFGRVMMSSLYSGDSHTVNTSGLKPGAYILQLQVGTKTYISKVIKS